MDEKLTKYYRWYENTYASIINLKQLEEKADKEQNIWLKKITQNFQYRFSSIWRHEILTNLRYYFIPKKTEYICTSFHIIRNGSSSIVNAKNVQFHIIYAILYTYYDIKTKKFNFEFVSTCPTFKSADGEYRHRFITLNQMLNVKETDPEVFMEVENHITNQLKDKSISFEANYILPKGYDNKILKELQKEIDKMNLPILFYVSAWLLDFDRYELGILENHIVDGYKEAMFSNKDQKFYTELIKKIDNKTYKKICKNLSRFRKNLNIVNPILEVGQKFIPLTVFDAENADNIKLTPWREMYINSVVGDLVINGISPSFPIFDDWFFIQGNSFKFWDNKISHIKLEHSEIADEIIKKLEIARKGTYVINPINKKEMYISFNMEGLSEAIEIPMDYAEQEIVLANVILCSLNEHIGITMADVPNRMMDNDYYLMNGSLFKEFNAFSKIAFDFIYGLFCLNIKLGIIHGDLHLNNITLFIKIAFFNISTNSPNIINPHAIFNVVNEYYIFHHYGLTACLIDYSRAFIERDKLIKEFGEKKAEEIIYHQKTRLIRVFERDMPDFFNAFQDQIQVALIENFDIVFKIATGLDAYKLTRGLAGMIRNNVLGNKTHMNKYGDVKTVNMIIELLEKMNSIAYQYMTTNFEHLFNRNLKALNLENVNLIIIRECFNDFKLDNFVKKDINLVDFFSSENDLKYDIRNYDNFPETVKFEYIIENNIPTEELGLKNYEEYKKYLEEESIEKRLEKVQENIINERNIVHGREVEKEEKKEKKKIKKELKEFETESSDIQKYYYDT